MNDYDEFKIWYTQKAPDESEVTMVDMAAMAWQAARATPALPQGEHDLEDVRCQCCGYMTYHREHMGCIRSAYKQALPQVPEGMAIVPVETLKNAERYAWLKAHIIEQPTARSLMIESSEHKTEYVFPKLISWADFCGPITLDEAIDFKLAAAKEKGE